MTFTFKHPKYYTELRKRNKSDQAISLEAHDGECERAPDPGHKQRDSQVVNQVKLSSQSQATSSKRQASSAESVKPQATSVKPFAASVKLKPASVKLHDLCSTVHVNKFSGARTKGLCYDKCIVWMLNMEANLVW